jgi:hypothetical protein
MTNDFLSGKISSLDFITQVEYSEDSQSSTEGTSDTEDGKQFLEENVNDPEYIPEGLCKRQTRQQQKSDS